MARALRASGLSVFLPEEVGSKGLTDSVHLLKATDLGACLVSKNVGDFVDLHDAWHDQQREHAGILLSEDMSIGLWIERLRRAGQLLTPETIADAFLYLNAFSTDEAAQAMVVSLSGHP
ncbi:MAG: hypothetical protein ACYDAG_12270 [Chloroflexota bacterium]